MDSSTIMVFLVGVPAIVLLPERYTPLALSSCAITLLSLKWEGLVAERVQDPYLDEVFHIPQAQAYCASRFNVWDPKLTTPPGLYLISAALLSLFDCSVAALRTVNALALSLSIIPLFTCRSVIYKSKEQNWVAAHTALNICLFPPLFFFAGLYYTDVLSTLAILLAYEFFLSGQNSFASGLRSYILGLAALSLRQTNIFWVAVYLAGIEFVRVCKTETTWKKVERHDESSSMIREWGDKVEEWSHGLLHDPKIGDAGVSDFALCMMSIAVAAICNPIRLINRLWPYIALVISFALFVFWNGGVVLGDRSNHAATIHLPQILYIWPFMVLFSLPLLYPFVFDILASFLSASIGNPLKLSRPRASPNAIQTFVFILAAVCVAFLVVHFNTIIHPFTLADNRHYMFYVFRYTILRQPFIKYALVPFYVFGAYLVLRSLGGDSSISRVSKASQNGPEHNSQKDRNLISETKSQSSDTSFVVIWIISTTLSLVTAPLVEPRYFIIPWVIWRLHFPSITSTSFVSDVMNIAPLEFPFISSNTNGTSSLSTRPSGAAGAMNGEVVAKHDHRLYLETLWFAVINIVIGYLFLFRGFEWKQEPGNVQRFMW